MIFTTKIGKYSLKTHMSKLNISDSTNISMPVRNMLAIIGAVAMGVWAYFGITEQLNKHSTTLELMQKDLSENTEFRIKYPRGELGQSQNDLEALPKQFRNDTQMIPH